MQSYNDRWERTKRYLLRNFLVNPGFQLSSIPEEEHSSSSSSSSPESLPELVVEPEPDRHDHEPEYYEGLERRMRRYYRQLFLDDSVNEDSSDFEVNQSMASTFIIDNINNAREDPPALSHAVIGQINDYSDKDKDMYMFEMIGEKSTGSDENASVHFETSKALTEERSSDSDKYEFGATERFSLNTDKDQFEGNHVVTEEKHADSDKTSGTEDVTAEDMSTDSDTDENLLEVADVITEERRLDSHKDISDIEEIVTEANIADSDTDEDALEENNLITNSADSEMNELSKHDIVIEEKRSDYDKDEDISEAEDIVREETRHSSSKDDCLPEANSTVLEEIFDKTTALLKPKANRVAEGQLIDYVVDEVASTINEKQFTYTRDVKLPDNHVVTPHKDGLLIDYFKESSNFEEVGNSKLIRSRSGYFLVSSYNKSNIDLDEITAPDCLIHSSQVVSFQGDATNQSHDCSDLNKRLEAIDKDLSKTKSTSDSDESGPCHIISSTVVEVHETRPASPVLIPKSIRVSRGVSVPDDDRREACLSLSGDLEISDEIIERASYDTAENNEDEAIIGQTDTTVERLLSVSEVTNVTPDSGRFNSGNMPDDNVTDNRNINQEEDVVERYDHIVQSLQIRPGYIKPFTDDEESIGPDEFQYSTLDTTITERTGENDSDWNSHDTDEHSFKVALRRRIFESKNVRKSNLQSSDEEMDTTNEDFEPVEEIRAPREVAMRESLHRASVGTQDSPGLAFERQTSADKLEDVSTDSHEINASLEKVSERKSCRDPPLHKTNVVSALDDIWSVSPMELDIEQLLKETAPNKKRKPETDAGDEPIERKKRKDIAIQTSLSKQQSWEDIKTNFFVGKPLVLRLCGCPDHVCSKPTSQTG